MILTLYEGDTNQYRKQLLETVKTYSENATTLELNSGRSGAHEGACNIAPYYFLPTARYAAEGIEKFLADPNTSEKERADLATAKSKLSSAVNSLAGAQTDPATGLSNDSRFTGIGYRPEYYPFSHNEKSKGPSGILALFLIYLE